MKGFAFHWCNLYAIAEWINRISRKSFKFRQNHRDSEIKITTQRERGSD
jgi:hypothetical protein